ncbi:PQQ-dependent sugar dehydrogenase [Flaviflagellibacter deserti]|uniref:PQQ-dependent sugar dehydrogenase n=1 Tax=Flaviflagellibacter deserti TaxID=2267266 RepID=A0ABV9Z4U2_9HYPH
MKPLAFIALIGLVALPLAGCNEKTSIPEDQRYGANPTLPTPQAPSWFPTVNIAVAQGWPEGQQPKPAAGLAVTAFATGLQHPRTVYTLPNGDVLVAETDAPPKPDDRQGIRGWVMGLIMNRAGSSHPSANRITLLRDADGDGRAEMRTVFLENLNSPFGMVLVGQDFYVANTDAIVRFPYKDGDTKIADPGTKLADLPGGTINHHWTKDLTASPDGSKLYATVGSNSNVAENGMDAEKNRAAVLEVDRATGQSRVFASGLRNPNGPSFEPKTGQLWVAVNERDELGNDLVPDYMTHVQDGGFYGWPYSYFGQNVDVRVDPPNPDLVAKAIVPDYSLGAHTASLGLTFNTGNLFPADYAGGAFVGQHGSWNRDPRVGYKVIFVPFTDGKPSGPPRDVLTGFLSEDGQALGRPVGVRLDKAGALLVADDVGGAVWRVSPDPQKTAGN